jgi:hypothetical protein
MVTRRNAKQPSDINVDGGIDPDHGAHCPSDDDGFVRIRRGPVRPESGNHNTIKWTAQHVLGVSSLPSSSSSRMLFARRALAMGVGLAILATSILSTVVQMHATLENSRRRQIFNGHPQMNLSSTRSSKRKPNSDAPSSSNRAIEKISQKKKKKAKAAAEAGDGGTTNNTEVPLEVDRIYDDPPVFDAPVVDRTVKDFDDSLPGVIVTKIQGPPHLRALKQMLCLLTKAYNDKVHHDIIVFSSEPINATSLQELLHIVAPAKLLFEVDNPGLQQMVDALPPDQKSSLLERCGGVGSSSALTWYAKCTEVRSYLTLTERLAYNWQAEFRALHLWTHPRLEPYRYMMWMDSDAFCTRAWDQDPIATMARYDLALLFDHFPQGAARGSEFPALTRTVFNRTICGISMENGTLVARDGSCYRKKKSMIRQVHGFFHVSDLDFFRSDKVMEWNRAMIGDNKFSRLFDDQIGITIPAALLAGNRSRDMRSLGLRLRVFHNYVIDGEMKDWRGYFVPWWKRNANTSFPEASGKCLVDISA